MTTKSLKRLATQDRLQTKILEVEAYLSSIPNADDICVECSCLSEGTGNDYRQGALITVWTAEGIRIHATYYDEDTTTPLVDLPRSVQRECARDIPDLVAAVEEHARAQPDDLQLIIDRIDQAISN